MHLDGAIVLAGAIVGFAVGLTGMGGGALMTPVLVLLLHVQPAAAVSSDLVASVFMKPVGGAVHLRRGTVHLKLAMWLAVGAVPAGFAGAAFLNVVAHGKTIENDVKYALGAALLVAVVGLATRVLTQPATPPGGVERFPSVRVVPTVIVGVLGGFIVGVTSVGSGSLMIVALMFLYPTLTGGQLVGTDLVQSVPLVGAAALGQVIFGQVQLSLTLSLMLGAIPAVYLGARLSASAPNGLLRAAIGVMLLLSGLKLLSVSNAVLVGAGIAAVVVVVVAATVRARRRPALAGVLASAPGRSG